MDSVLSHQEDMVIELRELLKEGLFSSAEIKQIVIKRTEYENALARVLPKKSDYLRYVEYVMALEALRRKRVKRLNVEVHHSSPAYYCFIRAQFYIFQRAVGRFQDDIALWVQFIELARREKATGLAGRVAIKALLLHPSSVPLYILAASNQMQAGVPSAARSLMQKGLRLNKFSIQLWQEYMKMELEYIESRRRDSKALQNVQDDILLLDDEEVVKSVQPLKADDPGMQAIMDGAIVREIIYSAIKALPTIELFEAFHRTLVSYPTPLQSGLLDELHALLIKTLPEEPKAALLAAVWSLSDNAPQDDALVSKLRDANERLINAVKSNHYPADSIVNIYTHWVGVWIRRLQVEPLRQYLASSLRRLVVTLPDRQLTPELLRADLEISMQLGGGDPTRLGGRAQKYIERFPSSAKLWVSCLAILAEVANGANENVWRRAIKNAQGSVDDISKIWEWGVSNLGEGRRGDDLYQEILLASMRHPSRELHTRLLLGYIERLYHVRTPIAERLPQVKRMVTQYLPDEACFRLWLSNEASCDPPSKDIMEILYNRWREYPGSEVEAALRFASCLLKLGDGTGAKEVIERTRTIVDDDARRILEPHWRSIVQGFGDLEDPEVVDGESEDENMEREESSQMGIAYGREFISLGA